MNGRNFGISFGGKYYSGNKNKKKKSAHAAQHVILKQIAVMT